jgi:3-hydroxybutyryl-CoA dehydratase
MFEHHQESFTVRESEMLEFAQISGDYNPLHLDADYSISQGFRDSIVYGALVISRVSGIIASKFPGPGTVIGSIDWKFIAPIYVNQMLTVNMKLYYSDSRKKLLDLEILNDLGELVQEAQLTLFIKK